MTCPVDLSDRQHVAEGPPIPYKSRPPVAGPHYDTPYSPYGVVDHPMLPGFWVHNLELGTIVVLHNCPGGCPSLVAQLRALIAALRRNRNHPGVAARLLAIPSTATDQLLKVIAWGYLRELDSFDPSRITAFYTTFVDQGSECRDSNYPPERVGQGGWQMGPSQRVRIKGFCPRGPDSAPITPSRGRR